MILEANEAETRLNNPDNLINQLRSRMNSGLVSDRNSLMPFGFHKDNKASAVVSLPPSIDDLIDDAGNQITATARANKIDGIKDSAVEVLDRALNTLKIHIDTVDNPTKLSKIATDMSRIINDGDDSKSKGQSFNQVIVYRPIEMNINTYETIRVHE